MTTMTVADSHMFQMGDRITIGYWPTWTQHIPTFRVWIRWAARKVLKRQFGPYDATITAVATSTTMTVQK